MELKGQVAVVTGASRGIGRAIALLLANNGADVVVNYAGNEEAANEVKTEIEEMGQKAITIKADISKAEEVSKMFEQVVEEFGGLDILVNNAGVTKDGLSMRMKEADWDSVIDTNLKGVFLCSQKASKYMMRNFRGKIVNVSSVVGATGNAGQLNYVAAKSGVNGMTKTLAMELALRGITVNAVSPGFIQTDMTDKLSDKVKEDMLDRIPLKAFGKPEDVAETVLFLVSDKANYITGQNIHVNGGMYM